MGAALLCRWTDGDYGLGGVSWVNELDGGENFRATVGSDDARNVLRFRESSVFDERLAAAAAHATRNRLECEGLTLSDVGAIVAAPARQGYRAALARQLDVSPERVIVGDDERTHTASLGAALQRAMKDGPIDVLLVAAGAGITAGAALYREPPV